MTATAHVLAERPRIGLFTKLTYAVGAVPHYMKQRVLSTFLLVFYNQVVGLPPAAASTIIMVSLVFDAIVDPTVGQISDNTRSRWGRRHPFMYAAALPTALTFFLLWNPPVGWSDAMLVGWLLVALLALRFCDTFFELPATALLPELTEDYDERTRIISMRQFFAVTTGLGMVTMAYTFFLKENPDGSGGVLAREGYLGFSLTGAILIFASMLICALGTHRQIPWLRPPPKRTPGLLVMFREVGATLNNRSFIAAATAGIFSSVTTGLKGALDVYWWLYLFGLKQTTIATIAGVGVAGSVTGVFLAPLVIGKLGKKRAAIIAFCLAAGFTLAPTALWLLGWLPPTGSPGLVALLMADQFINSACWTTTTISTVAMMADVVEDAEVRTGRRSEGLLFSAEQFFKKGVSGFGVLFGGLMLTAAAFPQDARRAGVEDEVLTHLALLYVGTQALLFLCIVSAVSFFTIDRARHTTNLAALAARRVAESKPQAGVADG